METILINILMLIFLSSYAQTHSGGNLVKTENLSIKPIHQWISIPNQDFNIWEIGRPLKTNFNNDYDKDKVAIITDSINNYGINIDNYLLLSIPIQSTEPWIGEGILSFWHKYDMDSLNDGGFIEISYDKGNNWMNLIHDNQTEELSSQGLYSESDTIKGNISCYTGELTEWEYVEIDWWWYFFIKKSTGYVDTDTVNIRFRFLSDDKENQREGWIIDNLIFKGYDPIGGDIQDNINEYIKVFPIPSRDYIEIEATNEFIGAKIEIFDSNGMILKSIVQIKIMSYIN